MRKVIAAFNFTLDGVCDHTAGLPDADIHDHYTTLLEQGGVILYGRTTFQLMEYWRAFLEQPSEQPSMNAFAKAIDAIPKIVFSHTLKDLTWQSATLAKGALKDTVLELKQQEGAPILVGSRSLILQLMALDLIDEYQFCIYPVVAGGGLPLFETTHQRRLLKLINTKTFKSGAIILYYQPLKQQDV